jgi:hypothetical protein
MSGIGLGLLTSQPTHASVLLLMTCFAYQTNESLLKHLMPWFSYELCKGFIIKKCEQCVNLNQCAQRCSFCITTCPSFEFDPSQDWSKCFCLSGCRLSCVEVSYQNLSDPISEIAFSRVGCESLFRYTIAGARLRLKLGGGHVRWQGWRSGPERIGATWAWESLWDD